MRRIRLLVWSVAMLAFSGLFLTSLSAQTTLNQFTNKSSTNSNVAESARGNITDIAGTGIDASGITSTVEEASLYSKNAYEVIYAKDVKNLDDIVGSTFYSEFSRSLGQAQGKTSEDVKSSIVAAYYAAKQELQSEGSKAIRALNAVVAKTVTNLQ